MKAIFSISLLLMCQLAFTQADTSSYQIQVTGYAELYYSYDFNQPSDHSRPGFIYSHNRHNEMTLNLGFVKGAITSDRIRGNLALAAGTYMNANYALENGVLKNIYEANAGYRLSKSKNLWLDAGIFASHIGFESAVSKDCRTLTRSMLADNSPYFESGMKLTYMPENGKWTFAGLWLNGWQRIQRPDGNQTPAFGMQISYTPSSKVSLNYSNFIGSDKPDDTKQMRYFHNLYSIIHPSERWHITAGFDIGMEQTAKGSSDFNTWLSPVLILSHDISDVWAISARGEYYRDENNTIVSGDPESGFVVSGFSVNLDAKLSKNMLWRIEGRSFQSETPIWLDAQGELTKTNTALTTSFSVSF